MSLDPGIAAASLGACGVIITAILRFAPKRNANTDNYVSKELFDERTKGIAQSLDRIETKLNAHCAREMET